MLKNLYIKNYVLIEELNFVPSKTFNTITGETGAGKSIILGALGLITGNRADTQVLLNKENKCTIEVIFDVKNYQLKELFLKNDIDYEEECIIRREISASGKSRAFVNDIPVTLNVLREITEFLIDIHSQHETYNLLKSDYQLDLLDILAKNETQLLAFKEKFKKRDEIQQQLRQLLDEDAKNREEYDFVKFQYEELETARLNEEEQEELEQEKKVLENTEDIKRALALCNEILSTSEVNVSSMLGEVKLQMGKITAFSKSYLSLAERINQAYYELDDIISEIERENDKTDFDPERLQFVEERLNLIYTLQHKHRKLNIKELLLLKEDFEQRIQKTDNFDLEIEKLKSDLKNVNLELSQIAETLSKNRQKVVPSMEKDIKATLQNLGMSDSDFKISIEKTSEITSTGNDKVQFLFSANKGKAALPIQSVASGGEMSRLMLSIKAFMANVRNLPTIIFDEIDTGVSGNVADKVGQILEKISNHTQVLAITHLPQLAAKGNKHFKVFKETKNNQTISVLKELSNEQRVNEIASMLSGSQVTEEAIKNARVLLKERI